MATYREISAWTKANLGFGAQTCWIADVKDTFGLTRGNAPNRVSSTNKVKPCPADKRPGIEAALRHFGMI